MNWSKLSVESILIVVTIATLYTTSNKQTELNNIGDHNNNKINEVSYIGGQGVKCEVYMLQ